MEKKKNLDSSQDSAVPSRKHELKTLYQWSAPGRPFKKRTKTYFTTTLLILFFVEILLFLFGQYALMLVISPGINALVLMCKTSTPFIFLK